MTRDQKRPLPEAHDNGRAGASWLGSNFNDVNSIRNPPIFFPVFCDSFFNLAKQRAIVFSGAAVVSATIVLAVSHPSHSSWNFATSESSWFWLSNSRWIKPRFHCLDRVGWWNYGHKAKSPVGSTASFQGNSFESIARRTRSCPVWKTTKLVLVFISNLQKCAQKNKKKQYISRSKHPNCLLGSL